MTESELGKYIRCFVGNSIREMIDLRSCTLPFGHYIFREEAPLNDLRLSVMLGSYTGTKKGQNLAMAKSIKLLQI